MRSKKMWIALIITGIISFGDSLTTTPQAVLSLEEAVALGLSKNYDIQSAQWDYEKARNSATPANASLLPTVIGTGNVLYTNANDPVAPGGDTENTVTYLGLQAKYTLFNGLYNINLMKSLNSQERYTAALVRSKIEQTIMQVIGAYLKLVGAVQNVTIAQETYNLSRLRYERSAMAKEYGGKTSLDLLRAEVDFMSDSTKMIVAKYEYDKALRALNELLARDISTPIHVDTTLTFTSSYSLPEVEKAALNQSSTLRAAREKAVLADLQVSMNRTAFSPQIDISGGLNTSKTNDGFDIRLNDPRNYATAGLNATWYFYDGRAFSTYKNSKIEREKAEMVITQEEQRILRDAQDRYAAYLNSLEVLAVEQKSVAAADLALQRTEELARLGQVTSTDFREVQRNTMSAKERLVQARNTAKLAEYELLRLQGKLVEPVGEELKE